MLIAAVASLVFGRTHDYPAPSNLSDRAILDRLDQENAWLTWYRLEPSIIREKRNLLQLSLLKRDYVHQLDEEIERRTRNRASDSSG
jgi:hypothetical protein